MLKSGSLTFLVRRNKILQAKEHLRARYFRNHFYSPNKHKIKYKYQIQSSKEKKKRKNFSIKNSEILLTANFCNTFCNLLTFPSRKYTIRFVYKCGGIVSKMI